MRPKNAKINPLHGNGKAAATTTPGRHGAEQLRKRREKSAGTKNKGKTKRNATTPTTAIMLFDLVVFYKVNKYFAAPKQIL